MYNYSEQKTSIFTEDGITMFIKVRDGVRDTLSKSGAITMDAAMRFAGSGSSWAMMACVDRLVETKELTEINYGECCSQHRIFVSPRIFDR